MKKVIALILAVMMLCCVFAACGSEPAPSTPPADSGTATPPPADTTPDAPPADTGDEPADLGDPVSLTLGHLFPTTDYRGAAYEYIATRCAELSDGNITITTFPSQTLTTSQDALKSVASGVADMGVGALSFNVSEVPDLAPVDVTGIYDPAYFAEVNEAVTPALDAILATQNQKLLLNPDESNMIFYLNDKNAKEIHAPSDLSGLRLRDHGLWIGKSITAMGASPMTVMPADLTVALERGTVDGGYTGWGFSQTYRCHEVAPNITYTELAKSCFSPLTINLDVWNGMSAGQQAIMLQAVEEAEAMINEGIIESYAKFEQEVADLGGSIYIMTTEENQAFVDACAPLIDQVREACGDLGNALIDAFLAAPSNYR
ncbi:MAG: TRAP transporter substrate-binding protein DctP [Oscillospiraceae bacterium]|nr:TRAP transporter substrate-binding protein DctP [Oscillospiraceae bacterium]